MNSGRICVSICASDADSLAASIRRAEPIADLIEIRFDCLTPDAVLTVLESLPPISGQYLITYRPSEEGGMRVLPRNERVKFWIRAGRTIEGTDHLADHETDLSSNYGVPLDRRIVSTHIFNGLPDDTVINAGAPGLSDAGIVKVAVKIDDAADAIPLWKLLENLRRDGRDCVPIAMGEAGKWTRILGLAHGAFMTYASLAGDLKTAPGQITAEDLSEVYRVRTIDLETQVFGVIAGDTSYSMSPYIHNVAFHEAGLNCRFIPLTVKNVENFLTRMVRPQTREIDLNFRGFAVTNPHKTAIIPFLDELDESSKAVGAVNTVSLENGRLIGMNTDAEGFIGPLTGRLSDLTNASAAVFGSGGAARACVYALKRAGADVTIFARDRNKSAALAEEFKVSYHPWPESGSQLRSDILVNATPVGTKGSGEDRSILDTEQLGSVALVYDLTYNPQETRLISAARAAGCRTIGGLEMLVAQAQMQSKIWTGVEADTETMRSAALKHILSR